MNRNDKNIVCWINRIQAPFQEKELEIAASIASEALDQTNHAAAILEIAGMVEYARGNYSDAIYLIEHAMFEITLSISAQMVLGKSYLKSSQPDLAKTTFSFLIEQIRRVSHFMLPDLIHAVVRLKRYDWALVVCRELYSRNPNDHYAVFGASTYMLSMGYPKELVCNVMTKAVELNPTNEQYRLNLLVVCCSLSHWAQAYDHALHLSDRFIRSVRCKCLNNKLRNLFMQFGDVRRAQLLSTKQDQ